MSQPTAKRMAPASSLNIEQLSGDPGLKPWVLAIFAHNEQDNITAALDSIGGFDRDNRLSIFVLANGCLDDTASRVREAAGRTPNLWLVESDVGDKALAWNDFVYRVIRAEQLDAAETFVFMDGDVTLSDNAIPLLAQALSEVPEAEAVGGMPGSGRNRDQWRHRMPQSGILAGNCYALRPEFLQHLARRGVRMPRGLVGDDFFVSWLVASNAWREELDSAIERRCIFQTDVLFYFRSLSPWRWSDYRTYLKRKWRYTLRGIQHHMLTTMIVVHGVETTPRDVDELYRKGPTPSRLVGLGIDALFHIVAVQWIRARRKRPA